MSYSDHLSIEESAGEFVATGVNITANIESEMYELYHVGEKHILPKRSLIEVTFTAWNEDNFCRIAVLNGYKVSNIRDICGQKTPEDARDIYERLVRDGFSCIKIENTYK